MVPQSLGRMIARGKVPGQTYRRHGRKLRQPAGAYLGADFEEPWIPTPWEYPGLVWSPWMWGGSPWRSPDGWGSHFGW